MFTRNQALSCGISSDRATKSIKTGAWTSVAGRGYVINGQPIGLEQAAWAVTLSAPGAVLWGPTAFKLRHPQAPAPQLGFVTVARPGGRLRLARVIVRRIALAPTDWSTHRGLAVQESAPALMDALAWLPQDSADRLYAWALAHDAIHPDTFGELIAAHAGRRNHRRLIGYGELIRSGAGSVGELRFQAILTRAGITGWSANARVRLPDGSFARADILFAEIKLVVEVDGWSAHGSKDAFQRDRERQNRLIAAGYRVLRFTWQDINERPDHCADQVRQWLS